MASEDFLNGCMLESCTLSEMKTHEELDSKLTKSDVGDEAFSQDFLSYVQQYHSHEDSTFTSFLQNHPESPANIEKSVEGFTNEKICASSNDLFVAKSTVVEIVDKIGGTTLINIRDKFGGFHDEENQSFVIEIENGFIVFSPSHESSSCSVPVEDPCTSNVSSSPLEKQSCLEQHSITESDSKLTLRNQCSAQFKYGGHCKQLSSTNSDEESFSCSQCSAEFKCKNGLKQHFLTHPDEKPFTCNQCSAQFKCKGNHKRHMVTHSGERPFVCSQCSARFNQKSNLKQHLVTHSDEKPFACNQCSAQFKCKGNYKMHMVTHSGERPFVCSQCSARFKRKYDFKRHLLTHSKEKPFACSQCSAKFQRKDIFNQHMLTHF